MSDFAAERIHKSEYDANEPRRIVDIPLEPTESELYMAMVLLDREVGGRQAIKFPAKILSADRNTQGIYIARMSLHDSDMREFLRVGATFDNGYWSNIRKVGIGSGGVPAKSGYLKSGRTEVDDTLDRIFEEVGSKELALA